MEEYKCKICNYITNKISNLERHKNSDRHIKNVIIFDHEPKEPIVGSVEPVHKPEEPKNGSLEPVPKSEEPLKPGKNINKINKKKGDNNNEVLYKCEFCGAKFGYNQSYNRHVKQRCKKRKYDTSFDEFDSDHDDDLTIVSKAPKSSKEVNDGTTEMVKKIFSSMMEMKNNISNLTGQINNIQEQIKEDKSNLIDIAKNSAQSSNKSMSITKFAVKKLHNAPPLNKLNKKDVVKLIEYKPDVDTSSDSDSGSNDSTKKKDKKKKHSLEEIIVFKFNKKMLVDFVGDLIVEGFTNNNPKMQSAWGTDIARMMFIIKERVGTTNKSEWVKDPKGTKLSDRLVKPVYEEIANMMKKYTVKISNMIEEEGIAHTKCAELTRQSETAFKVISEIHEKKLQKATLKHIAPYFGFNESIKDVIDDYDSPNYETSDGNSISSSDSDNVKKPKKVTKKVTKKKTTKKI